MSVFYAIIFNHQQTNITKYALQGIIHQQKIAKNMCGWGQKTTRHSN